MNLKERRLEAGLTQEELAELCGCSRSSVLNAENSTASEAVKERIKAVLSRTDGFQLKKTQKLKAYKHRNVPFKNEAERKRFHQMWMERYTNSEYIEEIGEDDEI